MSSLRARADGYVAQPEWACPADDQELLEFAERHRGAVVLKPSNGQASAGVTRCSAVADVLAAKTAYDDFSGDPLRAATMARPRLMVEQLLCGPECSVECLVADGDILFLNITAKTVAAGEHPVELGHTVPTILDPVVEKRLRADVARLVRLGRVGTGVLHSEWIFEKGIPHLVECAGRLPGDNITALISRAWGFDFVGSWVELMSGRRPALPTQPQEASAIWFLTPTKTGTVRTISGVPDAVGLASIVEVDVAVSEGDSLSRLRSSWTRIGHVMASGESAPHALSAAQRAAELIKIDVV